MEKNKPNIFLGLINYGTQAGMLSEALRELGQTAFSVGKKDPYKRKIDFNLYSGGSFIEKIIKHGINVMLKLYWFFKFDHFHFFYGQTLFKNQRDLKWYRFFGKSVTMEYLGWDVQLYKYSIDKYKITNAAYYKSDSQEVQIKQDKLKIERLLNETTHIAKQYVCAPYLSEFVVNSSVLPLGINVDEYIYKTRNFEKGKLNLLHAPTSRGNKGSEFVLTAVKKLKEEGYNINLQLVERVSHAELKDLYYECDVFVGQILVGWYGTADIEAMALGTPTVCFYRESYFNHIDYGEKIPLINANPETIYDVLLDIYNNKYNLEEIGAKSRAFVEEVHDANKVVKILLNDIKKIRNKALINS